MRVSSYVGGTPLATGEYLVFQGYSGALDLVPPDLGRTLVERRGEPIDAAVAERLGARIEHLTARGYVTERSVDEELKLVVEIASALHGRDLATATPGFVVIPTYSCNLRCPYCFQGHDLHASADVLTHAQVDRIVDVMTEFARPGGVARALGLSVDDRVPAGPDVWRKSRQVSLFGGEPLSEQTAEPVRYLVRKVTERGFYLKAVTNGVELDRFADLLGPGLIEAVQITLDGPASVHDKRRVSARFPRTFGLIADNVDLALSRGTKVVLRMNVDTTTLPLIEELDRFVAGRGWFGHAGFSAGVAPVTSRVQFECEGGDLVPLKSPGDLQNPVLAAEVRELRQHKGARVDHFIKTTVLRMLRQFLASQGYPFGTASYCAATSGQLMFDARGDLYTCWEELGYRTHRIGEYMPDPVRFDRDVLLGWLGRSAAAIPECAGCPYVFIHNAGCASKARRHTGKLLAAECEAFKETFPGLLAECYGDVQAAGHARGAAAPPANGAPAVPARTG